MERAKSEDIRRCHARLVRQYQAGRDKLKDLHPIVMSRNFMLHNDDSLEKSDRSSCGWLLNLHAKYGDLWNEVLLAVQE